MRWFGALALLYPVCLPAQAIMAAPITVPPGQEQAFALGYSLHLPSEQVLRFLDAVKGLQKVTDDRQGSSETAQLAQQAIDLRNTEAEAYKQAADTLKVMGAPQKLQAWANLVVVRLTSPLVLTKEAKHYAKSQPEVAAILATIDEAQAIKAQRDVHLPSLTIWLKLAQGSPGLWASEVGALTAGLHFSILYYEAERLPSVDVVGLRDTAPAGTPQAVHDAFALLAPKVGNLASLTATVPAKISLDKMVAAHDALIGAFGAQALEAKVAPPTMMPYNIEP